MKPFSARPTTILRRVGLTATVAMSLALPAQALASGGGSSQITPTAPSRLSKTPTASHGSLPNTGLDLLPETVAGVVLLSAGLGLRARRSHA